MSSIPPIGAAAPSTAADPSAASSTALNDAFATGIVQFMGVMLQGTESDVQDACNDTTSTPDAPS